MEIRRGHGCFFNNNNKERLKVGVAVMIFKEVQNRKLHHAVSEQDYSHQA
jgi:hypothetical protein